MFPSLTTTSSTATITTVLSKAAEGEGSILEKVPDEVIRNILLYTGSIEYNPYLSVIFRRIIRCDIDSISSSIYSIINPVKISATTPTTTRNKYQRRRRTTANLTKSKKRKSYSIIHKRLKILNIIGRRCIISDNIESLIMILFLHHNNYSHLPLAKFALWSEFHWNLLEFANSKEQFPEDNIRKAKLLLYSKAKVFVTRLLSVRPHNKRCSFVYGCGYKEFALWLHKHMGYSWDEWEFAVWLQKEMDL